MRVVDPGEIHHEGNFEVLGEGMIIAVRDHGIGGDEPVGGIIAQRASAASAAAFHHVHVVFLVGSAVILKPLLGIILVDRPQIHVVEIGLVQHSVRQGGAAQNKERGENEQFLHSKLLA